MIDDGITALIAVGIIGFFCGFVSVISLGSFIVWVSIILGCFIVCELLFWFTDIFEDYTAREKPMEFAFFRKLGLFFCVFVPVIILGGIASFIYRNWQSILPYVQQFIQWLPTILMYVGIVVGVIAVAICVVWLNSLKYKRGGGKVE